MKLNQVQGASRKKATAAFTLIEMIGVLAVIAILAALLIPKVFNAINSARINNTAVSIDTMKTAVTDHYGKYGSFNLLNGNAATPMTQQQTNNYDTALLAEGLLDQPFAVKIGSGSAVQLIDGAHCNNSAGYKLDGVTNLTSSFAFVCEVVISNVLAQDALDLNALIDGSATNLGVVGSDDTGGRVEYTGTNGLVTVYVFLTGR